MQLWYPQATRRDGPPVKTGYVGHNENLIAGAVLHSMTGSYTAAMTALDNADRDDQGYFVMAQSWHLSVLKSGEVKQHYPLNAVCYHAGSETANSRYVGIEHEGGGAVNYSEPLTPSQLSASVQLVRWIAEQAIFVPSRGPEITRTLWEHNELYNTACPSGRIPWGEYLMTDAYGPMQSKNLDLTIVGQNIELVYVGFDKASGRDIYELRVLREEPVQ